MPKKKPTKTKNPVVQVLGYNPKKKKK